MRPGFGMHQDVIGAGVGEGGDDTDRPARSSGARRTAGCVCGRRLFRIGGPKLMFGTKWPSMMSRCSQSAPAASTAATSSRRRAKSAASRLGATVILPRSRCGHGADVDSARSAEAQGRLGAQVLQIRQSRGEEAVHAAALRPHARDGCAGSHPASAPPADPAISAGVNGSCRRSPRSDGRSHARRTFLGLQRAHRIDQPATGRSIAAAACSRRSCASVSARTSRGRLRCGTSGWRRIVPVALHGASSRIASNGAAATRPLRRPERPQPASCQCRRFCRSRASRDGSRSTATTAAPVAASCAVLPPGAAHRSATRSPGSHGEQPRRQRGGGILHPELTALEARDLGDPRSRREPHRTGGQSIYRREGRRPLSE